MRWYCSWIMVVVLALRGLLGDAMAMELMAGPNTLPAAISTPHSPTPSAHEHAHSHGKPSTPHNHASAASHPDSSHDCAPRTAALHCSGDAGGDAHCSSCMVCHSAWSLPSSLVLPSRTNPNAPPVAAVQVLTSAASASPLKPPIV